MGAPGNAWVLGDIGLIFQFHLRQKGIRVKLPPGDYFWRIASIDAENDQGPYSQTNKFTIGPQ